MMTSCWVERRNCWLTQNMCRYFWVRPKFLKSHAHYITTSVNKLVFLLIDWRSMKFNYLSVPTYVSVKFCPLPQSGISHATMNRLTATMRLRDGGGTFLTRYENCLRPARRRMPCAGLHHVHCRANPILLWWYCLICPDGARHYAVGSPLEPGTDETRGRENAWHTTVYMVYRKLLPEYDSLPSTTVWCGRCKHAAGRFVYGS